MAAPATATTTSTEQRFELLVLYFPGAVHVYPVDEVLNVNRQPKILLDDLDLLAATGDDA
jgi:hypothetical protein